MNALQQTYIESSHPSVRADLIKTDFDRLIAEKGRDVLIETAIICPCKGKINNHLSTCKNCGSTGYAFINPRETRLVLQGFSAISKLQPGSQDIEGLFQVSCMSEERISYMDKITALAGESINIESLDIKESNGALFSYAHYPIKSIEYIAQYVNDSTPYKQLKEGIDFSLTEARNGIVLLNGKKDSITVRYVHAPIFHISEMRRETMQSFRLEGSVEKQQFLPLHAFAKRAHAIANAANLTNDRLLNNSKVA